MTSVPQGGPAVGNVQDVVRPRRLEPARAERARPLRQVGPVLPPGGDDHVAAAARGIDAVLASPGPHVQVASAGDDPGAFTEDFCRWREVPEIERLARHSRVPAIAAALMATPQVRFYHDHVLVKEGGTR